MLATWFQRGFRMWQKKLLPSPPPLMGIAGAAPRKLHRLNRGHVAREESLGCSLPQLAFEYICIGYCWKGGTLFSVPKLINPKLINRVERIPIGQKYNLLCFSTVSRSASSFHQFLLTELGQAQFQQNSPVKPPGNATLFSSQHPLRMRPYSDDALRQVRTQSWNKSWI